MGKTFLRNLSLVLASIVFIGLIICASTSHWYVTEVNENAYFHEGLWTKIFCEKGNCKQTVLESETESWLIAVKVFLLLSITSIIIVVVTFILMLKYERVILYPIAITVMCVFTFVTLVIYAACKKTVSNRKFVVSFAYSFIVGWASFAVNLVAACISWFILYKYYVKR